MKTWLRWFVWLLEIGIVLGVVYFEPTYHVRGMLHREAFFQDRPTSYWRGVVESDLRMDPHAFLVAPYYVPPTLWERCTGWFKFSSRVDSSHQLLDNEAALPVLNELAQDSSPQIAAFARDAVDLERNLPSVRTQHSNFDALSRESKVGMFWMKAIEIHNMGHHRAKWK